MSLSEDKIRDPLVLVRARSVEDRVGFELIVECASRGPDLAHHDREAAGKKEEERVLS